MAYDRLLRPSSPPLLLSSSLLAHRPGSVLSAPFVLQRFDPESSLCLSCMFKKPVKQASSNPLGGKEAKKVAEAKSYIPLQLLFKLRGDILKKFDINEDVLDSFFGAKDKLNVVKLSEPHPQAVVRQPKDLAVAIGEVTGACVQLYCNEDEPYFCDISGQPRPAVMIV
eukprot:756517-Hanusia_phi.AAC.1